MSARRGFTLIEVMVAMAILAMGMTIILSSQAGLFATAKRVQDETYAASLVRCKMSEIELDLLENGYPLIEQNDSGDCCEDEDSDYTCEWTIQTVELPQPPTFAGDAEEGAEDAADAAAAPLGSPLGDAASMLPTQGSGLAGIGDMTDLSSSLGETAEGGGMIGMALSLVYPSLKPMLEASIRKVKVSVLWREGEKERRLDVEQYVTNPLEGNLNPNVPEDGEVPGATDSDAADSDTADSDAGESE